MASSIAETQLVSGDIFFQSGMYKKKLNVKTASNISFTGDIIDLTQYTQGETWDQVSIVYSVVEISSKQSEDVRSYHIYPKYLSENNNIFKFVATINGKDAENRVAVSWFAREEIIDIKGEKFSTKESHLQSQSADFNLQNQVGKILSVTSDNGTVSGYALTNNNTTLHVELRNGTVYATYSKPYRYEELGKPGDYRPSQEKRINENLWYDNRLGTMPFSGVIKLTTNIEKPQNWNISNERVYIEDTTTYYNPGAEYNHNRTSTNESKNVITRSVHIWSESYYPYTKHYKVYCQFYNRAILRDCVWTGTVYAQTYLYLVNVSYIKKDNKSTNFSFEDIWVNISQEELIQNSTAKPPASQSYVLYSTEGENQYRYLVTKVVNVINNTSYPYSSLYNVYGIKQILVKNG